MWCDHWLYHVPLAQLLAELGEAVEVYYNYSGQANCLNLSVSSVDSLGQDGWSFQVEGSVIMIMIIIVFVYIVLHRNGDAYVF